MSERDGRELQFIPTDKGYAYAGVLEVLRSNMAEAEVWVITPGSDKE